MAASRRDRQAPAHGPSPAAPGLIATDELPFDVASPAERAPAAKRRTPSPTNNQLLAWIAAPTDTSALLPATLTEERPPSPNGDTAPDAASRAPILPNQENAYGAAGNAPGSRSGDASLPAHNTTKSTAADTAATGTAAVHPVIWNHVDLTVEHPWYGAPKGEAWRVLFYDPHYQLHFAGIGPNALAALAACIEDYDRRGVRQLPHRMSRTA